MLAELSRKELIGETPIRPKDLLLEQARTADRSIGKCWWFRPVQIDFDLPDGEPSNLEHQRLMYELSTSLKEQGHPVPGRPSKDSEMIIGFHDLPEASSPLMERIEEIGARALEASRRYDANALLKNYTLVISTNEDVSRMPKREMENVARAMMTRLGALKIVMINPEDITLATMEGGLGGESRNDPLAIHKIRDRLVTHACAKDAGSFKPVENVIDPQEWQASRVPGHTAAAFRQFGAWGYIDKPFMVSSVASTQRARLVERVMGWSRQSESAGAVFDPSISVPEQFRIGEATGVISATKSGRFGADKTKLTESDIIGVTIRAKPDYSPAADDPLSLYGFDRYALGLRGVNEKDIPGPSIEFDEMAATFYRSPLVRVSPHSSGEGYTPDPEGKILMPRIRAFLHTHIALEEIRSQMIWGKNALEVVEYVSANLEQYPYPVGCGKDIMFACSTDAAQRSRGVQDPESGILLSFFDAIDHGTNILVLTEPLPGTDLIPDNPWSVVTTLLDPDTGPMRVTEEIPQI